jgi:hypothetical protein
LTIDGPSHGNPFVDVELSAEFTGEDARHLTVGGFYDGDGTYRIRFQAPSAGTWTYVTTSTARSLEGLRGAFEVKPPGPGNHGPVEVADRFHFAYRDGTRFLPFGTTAYAWTHQPAALQERTLATLASSPFRKLRMCVFPKSYLFNTNEPDTYPFARDSHGDWDFTRFDPQFFRHLETRIDQLAELGIQADLILFHPYDRWGFSAMGKTADDRYVQYLVRRLGAHPGVWWALANEYDLLPGKTTQDWERLAAIVRTNDHVGHLTSIHNCHGFYDHGRPWVTHCSIQRVDAYRTSENTSEWRDTYAKPVVIDECGYEGDIDQGWGNISGQEIVRRCWEGAVRGGYVGHGETYLNEREELCPGRRFGRTDRVPAPDHRGRARRRAGTAAQRLGCQVGRRTGLPDRVLRLRAAAVPRHHDAAGKPVARRRDRYLEYDHCAAAGHLRGELQD